MRAPRDASATDVDARFFFRRSTSAPGFASANLAARRRVSARALRPRLASTAPSLGRVGLGASTTYTCDAYTPGNTIRLTRVHAEAVVRLGHNARSSQAGDAEPCHLLGNFPALVNPVIGARLDLRGPNPRPSCCRPGGSPPPRRRLVSRGERAAAAQLLDGSPFVGTHRQIMTDHDDARSTHRSRCPAGGTVRSPAAADGKPRGSDISHDRRRARRDAVRRHIDQNARTAEWVG